MTQLKISIHHQASNMVDGVPVRLEIVNTDTGDTSDHLLYTGSPAPLEQSVGPGAYLIRARMPDGTTLKRAVQVEKQDEVAIAFERKQTTPHEWLAYPQVMGAVRRFSISGLQDLDRTTSWARIWKLARKSEQWSWEIEPAGVAGVYFDAQVPAFNIPMDPQNAYAVQWGSERAPWRIALLPKTAMAKAFVHASAGNKTLELKITSQAPRIDALVGFLCGGDPQGAQLVGDALVDELEKNTAESRDAVLGYYLLRCHDYARLLRWLDLRLGDPRATPDADVLILALTYTLQTRNLGLISRVLPKLTPFPAALIALGLPVYTEGASLLINGLKGIAGVLGSLSTIIPMPLDAITSFVSRYAQTIDWSKPYFSYQAAAPLLPSAQPTQGIPTDRTGLSFLRSTT